MVKIDLKPIGFDKKFFDEAAYRRVSRNVRTSRAKAIEVDFNTTTATWSDSPKANVTLIGDDTATIVMLDDRYTWTNDGTAAHVIRPRNASLLVFQSSYKSKTTGGFIGSRSGGSFGPTVYARSVQHPGTAARKFDQQIADKWNRLLPGIIERSLLAEL